MQDPRPARWSLLLAQVLLACLVCGTFLPVVNFEFVNLDVPAQVTRNPHIQGLSVENVKHILTSFCLTSYYPVRTLSYAVDHEIWGLNPTGFKLTNILIHIANVFLVFWLLVRLFHHPIAGEPSPTTWRDAAVATFAAGIFAIHPISVEPVAWVSGREELLMVLGALGCVHFHVTARRLEEAGGKTGRAVGCYAGAALCCVFACLSNAVAAVIPLLIVAWDLLTLGRGKLRRIAYGTLALWGIGAATVLLKKLGDATDPTVPEFGVFTIQRLLVILNVYWLNLKTLVWPSRLTIDYWNVEPTGFGDAGVILGGLAIGLTCVVLWQLRRRPAALFGLLWFGIAMGPTSQIMPHHIDRADRFLYLPLVGLMVAAAMLLRPLAHSPGRRWATPAAILLGASILLALNARSVRRVQVWRNSITLWENCLALVPTNAFGHACLAEALSDEGRFPEAIEHYETSLRILPDEVPTLSDYAFRLAAGRQEEYRDYDRAIALAERGCRLSNWEDPRIRHTLALAHMNLATSLSGERRFERAIEHYHAAIEADPDYEVPLFNLAMLLATCGDETFRRPDEAVQLAERACALVEPANPVQLNLLARVYAETGRSEKATAAMERAIQRAQALGDSVMTGQLQSWLETYRKSDREKR